MVYTPPAANAINFDLASTTPPAVSAVNFDLDARDIMLVQAVKVVATAVGSQAVSFASTPTVGNLIVVCVSTYNGDLGASAVTDNQGNTYTRRSKAENAGVDVAIYDALAATSSGTFTVTVDPDGSSADITVIIMEFSGCDTSSPYDAGNSGTGNGTAVSSGNITPSANGALMVGVMSHAGTDRTLTEEAGWNLVGENEGGSSNIPLCVEIKVQATAAAEDADFTIGTGAVDWCACVVGYKAYVEPSGVTVTPDPADAATDTISPAVVLGAIAVSLSPSDAAADTVSPAVTLGAVAVTPTPSDAATDTVSPAVILGALTVTPDTADAAADTVNPVITLGSITLIPSPADAAVDTIDPAVIVAGGGGVTILPDPAELAADTVDPVVSISGGGSNELIMSHGVTTLGGYPFEVIFAAEQEEDIWLIVMAEEMTNG